MSPTHPKPKRVKEYRKYDPTLKREIARRYLAGDFSYSVAAEEYGLPGKDTVKEFVRWYRKELNADQIAIADAIADAIAGTDSQQRHHSPPDLSTRSRAELEQQIVELTKVAHQAETKAEAWRTVVKLASDYTGTDLVKKYAPKPSSK